MEEKVEIGNVFNFFAKPSVAAINITSGELSVGDTIQIKGDTTDFTQKIESMEIDRVKVEKATAGQGVGIKVEERVRPHDKVYKVLGEVEP
ncbi:MAG: translation elongation factor-like protein [Thermoplasmata archaeon]|nr:MAG: translation elongation factor-like protein [Thermoplasmata archaeon]